AKHVFYKLNDRCEGVLKGLKDLVQIHKQMNAQVDWKVENDPTFRLHLHKAYIHIVAITSWQMNGEVFHVMAPEIRAAVKALDPLVQEYLPQELSKKKRNRHSFLYQENDLKCFAHPTLFSLSNTRGFGGFGKTGYVRYLSVAYTSLSQLMLAYACAIRKAAKQFYPASIDEIDNLITKEASLMQSLDWDKIMGCLKHEHDISH
ncbi:MAG: hypothetical protein OXI59_00575, partial [Gemmatimonadota bacterium]|nr:hypothetical protein [Gemmatimonadota bacterium]